MSLQTFTGTVAIALEDRVAAADLVARHPAWRLLDSAMLAGPTARDPIGAAFIEWILPEMSGFELCRRLRDSLAGREAHITMVVDGSDPALRRRALLAGADDYLVGPVTARQIEERLSQRLRTPGAPGAGPVAADSVKACIPMGANDAISAGGFVLDPLAVCVRHGTTTIRLSRNEFDLLAFFMQRPNEVFSRVALVAAMGKAAMIGERAVDRRISRLRRSFEHHGMVSPVRTVWGLGYVFDAVDEPSAVPLRNPVD